MAIVVYLAGPIGKAAILENATRAVRYADRLRREGFVVICPHLCVLWALICPGVSYEEWLRQDLVLVERSDVIVRLEGYSPGASREVAHACAQGIPVVHVHYESDVPTKEILRTVSAQSGAGDAICRYRARGSGN